MAGSHERTMMGDSRTLSTQSIAESAFALSDGTNGLISNDALSGRRRRDTARHACHNCRRRKIKCDEARPTCKPCSKARAVCDYERPAGQTRNQALSKNQRRLQSQLRTFTSLIHALRCADINTSGRILRHLRHGDYDGILLCDNPSSDMTQHTDKVYPWEDMSSDEQPQPGSRNVVLPPVGDLMSMQRTSAEYPISYMIPQTPSSPKRNHQEYSLPSQTIAMPSVSSSEFGRVKDRDGRFDIWAELTALAVSHP